MNDAGFNDLPWHDAQLLSLEIDRRRPGVGDEVTLAFMWPDGRTSRIRFQDCWKLEASMNFGIVADDTVLAASEETNNDVAERVRAEWAKVGLDVGDLRCFRIETNSTASTISVYAQRWSEEPPA